MACIGASSFASHIYGVTTTVKGEIAVGDGIRWCVTDVQPGCASARLPARRQAVLPLLVLLLLLLLVSICIC